MTNGRRGALCKTVAVGALCLLVQGALHAQSTAGSCVWPMHAMVQAPGNRDYPVTVLLAFSKPDATSDLISIREITIVGLAKLARDYPSLVQGSDGWRELQSRLNCNDRAGDYSYGLSVVNGLLIASFGANIEKYWCTSSMAPCPVIPADPFRMCLKEANGKVWGARVSSASKIELQQDGRGAFKAAVVETTTSSNTSAEQNFVRDLIGAPFMGPIGIAAIRDLESSALNAIKRSMQSGFDNQAFKLSDGSALPEFPNYKPAVTSLRFFDGPPSGIGAEVVRVVPQYRESTGCALAKQLKALPVSANPGNRSVRGR